MSLETTLTDITACLRQGQFPNEQAISQGIVLRMLKESGRDMSLCKPRDNAIPSQQAAGYR